MTDVAIENLVGDASFAEPERRFRLSDAGMTGEIVASIPDSFALSRPRGGRTEVARFRQWKRTGKRQPW